MPTAQLFAQPCCSGVTLLETLERIRPRHLEMERVQMMTGCKTTLSRKARERAKVKTNTREEIARPARPTRALQTSTRARIVANLEIERKTAGIRVEERMTIPPTEILAKARVKTRAKGKAMMPFFLQAFRNREDLWRCRNVGTSASLRPRQLEVWVDVSCGSVTILILQEIPYLAETLYGGALRPQAPCV